LRTTSEHIEPPVAPVEKPEHVEVAPVLERYHLHLTHVNDPKDFAGVIRLQILISPESVGPACLYGKIENLADEWIKLGTVFSDSIVPVGVNFAMLSNGEHELVLRLEEPDGGNSIISHKLLVDNVTPLSRQTGELLRASNSPLLFLGPCDAGMYPYDMHQAWFDRPDAHQHIEELLASNIITPNEAVCLRQFVNDGFMVIDELIDEELVNSVNQDIDAAISENYQGYQFGTSQRIEHLHERYQNVRRLWLDPRHRRYADLIFGSPARPCQTLTYVFGSQQDAHQDTVHLTPFPAGYMCGTWIALQDVVADSGELIVYPGSHRERRVYLQETGCPKVNKDWSEFSSKVNVIWEQMAKRYEPFIYRPKKGTVLIWHENLLHAGSVRIDKSLERRSLVIHSFADGAVAFYDSTGLAGSAVARDLLTESKDPPNASIHLAGT
jgi:hypothetical protein